MPLVRRMPKRGFRSHRTGQPQIVNLAALAALRRGRARRHGGADRARARPRARRPGEGARRRRCAAQPDAGGRAPSARRRARRSKGPAEGSRSSHDRRHPEHRADHGAPATDLLHVRHARGLPRGCVHRDAGHQPGGDQELLRADAGHRVRAVQPVLGRRPRAALDLLARHHALHQRLDHLPAAHDRDSAARRGEEGRRGGAQEDQPVDPLRDDRAGDVPELPDRRGARERAVRRGRGAQPRARLQADVHDHAHLRHRLHHVARRADHGARDRQRHLADHLRRHHHPHPVGDRTAVPADPHRSVQHPADGVPARRGRRRGLLRGDRRTRPAPDSDPARAPRRGQARDAGRHELLPAAREHGRRDSGDLRVVAADVPAHDRPVHGLAGGAGLHRPVPEPAQPAVSGLSTSR